MFTSKFILTSCVFAALALPAAAATVEVSAMAPTLSGLVDKKVVLLTFDSGDITRNPAALYDRINRTALALCASNPGGHSGLMSSRVEQCRATAVRQAVRQVGAPDLAAVADGH